MTANLWVYLSTTPLLWLTITVVVYVIADRIAQGSGRHPVVNPVLVSVIFIVAVLWTTSTPYKTYFEGAQFVHFLLGPAIVAIAMPLYRNLARVKANLVPMLAALIAGGVTATVSALAIAAAFGVPHDVLASIAPKSVTAGVAMGISEGLGGIPALTAVLVILTGLIGAVIVTPLMNALGMTDYAARGFAAGLAAHGIGTARAFVVDEVAGTFAGIAMGLNAVLTAILVPIILAWFR
ncbi:MAG: LrgB family protein [Alphaproteobacteria bacterium]|nr:LrgB family protein [Alphaproteobacteria bacterium]